MGADTNERFRQMVERCPDAICVFRDSRLVFLNAAAVRLIGASSPDDGIALTLCDLFNATEHAHITGAIASRGTNGQRFEEKLVRRDGTTVDVEVTVAALGSGDRPELQLVLRDITERKRAETALRESEERLTLAFAGAQEGVWDWDLGTGAVVYSPRWKQMLGYGAAHDHEIEPHVSAWERLLHPDDRQRANEVNESVMRGAETYEGEFRLKHRDGHYIHVLSRGFPVRHEPGGPVVRIVGTHLDITERKRTETALRESEERLTLAFAGAQEGVWDWNLETGAVVYSPRWKQMLGYDDHEIEPHVSAWERLLHPDDRERANEVNESVMRGALTYEGEFRLRHRDGHYIQVLSRGFPVRREPGGPPVRIVGTHFDLTERKQADAERARTEMLGRLVFAQEDERRRISRDMHDRFGEQLTVLARRIGLLKEASANQRQVSEQVEALEAVSQQLDLEVDRLVWELRPTALDDLGLRAALAAYVQDWSKRVSIQAKLHSAGLLNDRLPSEIETALYRIAQEALTNVAKHARAHNVDVLLERRADHVMLIVEDDGVGFEAGHAGTAGQGFGLLGMQERAALVGATLEIESAPGNGTTILVRMAAPGLHA
jgi:PAS domain S-box-containing protein